jgi:light-regulated signal transduction histidine kinase (bacteriophytochrome)
MLQNTLNAEKFEEFFPHMENILHCGLYVYSFKTNASYWSQGMFSILGLEPYSVESTFENFSKYILPEDRDRVIEGVSRSRNSQAPYTLEFSLLNASGIYKRVMAQNAFKFSDGEPVEYSGVIKDITESYFYKKALEQKVLQLDKSNQNLQEFVYVASHDLQEPLRKISTFTERLQARFEPLLGQEGSMYMKRIMNSTVNMQTLLEDLLTFSRLSFHDKQFEPISLKECLDSVLADLEIKIEETKTTVVYDQLPEIEAYHSQIKQLFINLISNAVKFKKPNERPVIKITSELVTHSAFPDLPMVKGVTYAKILVKDNGIGFEQEYSERIFMIFQRLNARAEYAGSGIGLSICKKIVDNHHGFIFADGIIDVGATFTVLLPQKQG